jgi:hypothetical protein
VSPGVCDSAGYSLIDTDTSQSICHANKALIDWSFADTPCLTRHFAREVEAKRLVSACNVVRPRCRMFCSAQKRVFPCA